MFDAVIQNGLVVDGTRARPYRASVYLKDGKIAAFGSIQEVMTKETLSSIYSVDFEIMQIEGKPLTIYY